MSVILANSQTYVRENKGMYFKMFINFLPYLQHLFMVTFISYLLQFSSQVDHDLGEVTFEAIEILEQDCFHMFYKEFTIQLEIVSYPGNFMQNLWRIRSMCYRREFSDQMFQATKLQDAPKQIYKCPKSNHDYTINFAGLHRSLFILCNIDRQCYNERDITKSHHFIQVHC